MAKNISSKKPLSIKLSSHANNKTNSKQKPNLQNYTINGDNKIDYRVCI